MDQRVLYTLQLSSLDIDHSDIYDDWGLIRMSHMFIPNHYRRTSIYQSYMSQVIERDRIFQKKRKLNHFINQKNKNYEAF